MPVEIKGLGLWSDNYAMAGGTLNHQANDGKVVGNPLYQ
jgi:hypothetical protein